MITVETRRGIVEAILRADREVADGMVFMPFCFAESPANALDQSDARPVRQDPGVQVLRRPGRAAASVGRRNAELIGLLEHLLLRPA